MFKTPSLLYAVSTHGTGEASRHLHSWARQAGMKFGIWIEPKMVNPESELYEKHPDWVMRQPARPELL